MTAVRSILLAGVSPSVITGRPARSLQRLRDREAAERLAEHRARFGGPPPGAIIIDEVFGWPFHRSRSPP